MVLPKKLDCEAFHLKLVKTYQLRGVIVNLPMTTSSPDTRIPGAIIPSSSNLS
jgi:hypothetical protein